MWAINHGWCVVRPFQLFCFMWFGIVEKCTFNLTGFKKSWNKIKRGCSLLILPFEKDILFFLPFQLFNCWVLTSIQRRKKAFRYYLKWIADTYWLGYNTNNRSIPFFRNHLLMMVDWWTDCRRKRRKLRSTEKKAKEVIKMIYNTKGNGVKSASIMFN